MRRRGAATPPEVADVVVALTPTTSATSPSRPQVADVVVALTPTMSATSRGWGLTRPTATALWIATRFGGRARVASVGGYRTRHCDATQCRAIARSGRRPQRRRGSARGREQPRG